MTPILVYHVGNVNRGDWKSRDADVPIQMPTFYVLKAKTSASLITGETQMIAALSPNDEEGFTDSSRKLMLFVRADILTVGK